MSTTQYLLTNRVSGREKLYRAGSGRAAARGMHALPGPCTRAGNGPPVVALPKLQPPRTGRSPRARGHPPWRAVHRSFFNICSYTLHVSCIQLNPDVFESCVNITDLSCDTINHQLFSCDPAAARVRHARQL